MILNANQIQAITLLARGSTCKEVAEEIGVAPQTISEWKKISEFEATLNALKKEVLNAAVAQIQHLTGKAAATISDIMENGTPDSVRLKAAEVVLAHAGITDPSTGLYGWGIGATTAAKVEVSKQHDEQVDQLMASFSI